MREEVKFTSGLPETACGLGSTIQVTAQLRASLPGLLEFCGIKKLLDAPCGDGNWINETDLTGIEYCGLDLSREHLSKAISREPWQDFEPKMQGFICADIRTIQMPRCDAIMCRDFFQHLPNAEVLQLLDKIRAAEISWLLATSFDNAVNEEIGPDMFRPLNLQLDPFLLPAPAAAIQDPPGSGRILGFWPML